MNLTVGQLYTYLEIHNTLLRKFTCEFLISTVVDALQPSAMVLFQFRFFLCESTFCGKRDRGREEKKKRRKKECRNQAKGMRNMKWDEIDGRRIEEDAIIPSMKQLQSHYYCYIESISDKMRLLGYLL